MSTTQRTPESLPDLQLPGHHAPARPPHKSKKRGLVWVVVLLIVAGLAGYAVKHAGEPGMAPQRQAGGRGGGPRGAGLGPVPVVVSRVGRSSIPAYFDGLGD